MARQYWTRYPKAQAPLALGAEAGLLPGGGVLGVEDPCAPEQDEPLIHGNAFHYVNREAVRHYRVSS
jgi:hypothetical protein